MIFRNFIFYLSFIKSTVDDVQNDAKSTKDLETIYKPLSFSFFKDSFTHFRCNFNNDLLCHNLLKEPPFYFNKSVRNFIYTFCLFFQYSQIKNNEEFRVVTEILFEDYLKKVHKTRKNPNKFVYDPQTFIDHFERLDTVIMNILENNGNDFVSVQNKKKRFVITQKSSSIEDFKIKLIEPYIEDSFDDFGPEETVEAITDCYIKFKELYLQDLLYEDFFESLNAIHNEHQTRKKHYNFQFSTSEYSYEVILLSYANLCYQLEKESLYEEDLNEVKSKVTKSEKYSILLSKMYLSGKLQPYLNELISKAKAKYFYTIYKNLTDDEDFAFYTDKKEKYNLIYIKFLKTALKDTNKVYFINGELSEESFDNLIKNCLELTI